MREALLGGMAVPHARARASVTARVALRARTTVQITVGAVSFLLAYAVLQLLHAANADPAVVTALTAIPLFARFLASAACALPAGLVVGAFVRAPERMLPALPATLAASIVLFVLAVVSLP